MLRLGRISLCRPQLGPGVGSRQQNGPFGSDERPITQARPVRAEVWCGAHRSKVEDVDARSLHDGLGGGRPREAEGTDDGGGLQVAHHLKCIMHLLQKTLFRTTGG